MLNTMVYLALLIACCAYAFLRGGAPERVGAAIIGIGSILTYFAMPNAATNSRSVEVDAFVIDVVCLVAFLILALRAERYWPLWVTALQTVGTAGHAIKLADPEGFPWTYSFALAFWSYPMLFLLALGTWRHQQRLARSGYDKSWSSSSADPTPTPTRGPKD